MVFTRLLARTGLLRIYHHHHTNNNNTPWTSSGDDLDEHTNLLNSPHLTGADTRRFHVQDCIHRPGRTALFMSRFRAVRRRLRPWHGIALLACAAAITAAVAAGVLVTRRNHEKAVEADKNAPSDPSRARVNLGYAQYQGSLVGADGGVAQYLGLRYAAPPTGDRRWRAPTEPEAEADDDVGDQAADTFGPICLGIGVPYPNALAQDEDCLFANVWAPADAEVGGKLPVWVFIQGGGYTVNSNANWNGTAVVERSGRNIVFVNFNYRVGLWGFLASERVRANGAGDLNVGLLDQREVLRWVRRHIAQFGGDPDHVVIHGASAGAGSVALHLVAYGGGAANSTSNPAGTDDGKENERLFVGAVGESVFFPAQPFVAELEWQFDRALTATGCDNDDDDDDDDPMACLRSKDTTTLQAANVPSAFPGRPALPLPLFYWTPCIDGDLLRDLPYLLFERGEFLDVPVLMGATSDEGTVFASDAQTLDDAARFLQTNYPSLTDSQAADVLAQYPQMDALPMHSGAWFPSAAAAYGEATFVCPASYILDAYAAKHRNANPGTNTSSSSGSSSSRAWGYRTNIYDADNAAQGLGVPHIWECWAIFGPDSLAGIGRGPASYYTYAADVVGFVMDYWISFVRTLDPSAMRASGAPVWEVWDSSNSSSSSTGGSGGGGGGSRLVVQAENFTMEAVPTDQRERCEFWRGLVPATQQRRV